jgi:hypothetical protein
MTDHVLRRLQSWECPDGELFFQSGGDRNPRCSKRGKGLPIIFYFMQRHRFTGLIFRWSKIMAGIIFLSLPSGFLSLPLSDFWIDVPFIRAGNPHCGHACAGMLLQYWSQKGFPAGASDLSQTKAELAWDPSRGVSASSLVAFFHSRNFQAFAFKGTQEELHSHLLKGRPLIVGLGKTKKGIFHFVVVVGMGPGGRYILMNDPADRKMVKATWGDFEREWARTGKWTLLVLPSDTIR